ncbi:MAG TPA: hypothetical protein VLG49_03330, partial [Rhabdochlamydiaceae bacterium]|nr:hypothetical protein [Rhabdochlamydiaceae bacterium]
MTITNFFNKIANYFNNSLDVENKLLVVCEEFRKGNTEKAFKKFSQLPSETQKKIFNYQWKVLGKPASEANSPIVAHEQFGKLAFFNLENRSCTTLKKIEAIEKYLIHQIKQVLLSIQTDLDHCDDTKVYSKFSQVCALSKHIELIKNLENDI